MRTHILACTVVVIFSSIHLVYGQEIRLNVVTFHPCSSTYKNELLYEVIKGEKKYQIEDTLGTIYLPETGVYELRLLTPEFFSSSDSVLLVNVVKGQNYDTLTHTRIVMFFVVAADVDPYSNWGYECCGKLCEGYFVDYFDNGIKKMEGQFINGHPIGELIFYHPNGSKKEIHYYDKSGDGNLHSKKTFNKG